MRTHNKINQIFGVALVATLAVALPLEAHHSFAMYDVQKTKVVTGVVTRVDPSVNHLQIFFAVMNEERTNVERDAAGDPIVWSVEMAGSGTMARQGVTVNTYPPGTVFSVGLHPLRNGEPAGARVGGLFKCPERTPPDPGKHCDSVAGHTAVGDEPLASPAE